MPHRHVADSGAWSENNGDVFRDFVQRLRTWTSCEVDSMDMYVRLEDVRGLEGREREVKLVGEGDEREFVV